MVNALNAVSKPLMAKHLMLAITQVFNVMSVVMRHAMIRAKGDVMKIFVKSFKTEYGDIAEYINEYARKNNLEIVSVSIAEKWGYLNALVVFKEM